VINAIDKTENEGLADEGEIETSESLGIRYGRWSSFKNR
jgi:hypothetical protein